MAEEVKPQEIKLRRKYLRNVGSGQKSKSSNSGTKSAPLPKPAGMREAAMAATAANQRVLLLVDGRHRRFVRAADL